MSIFSRKTSINILLFSINIILLTIISRVVIADETTNAILEQSTYLYYYESDDELLAVGESQVYTFAPIPGEDITIVSYGLDDSALISVSLFDSSGNEVATGTTNQVTEKPENTATDSSPQSRFITAIQHTANSSGLYYFEVKNELGDVGLVRTMLFVGEPFSTDLTLIDKLNPLLPSKAFMVAGDPNREWVNELTGETIQGLRTEIDVLPIERIDRSPDVFLSYSTLSYLPDVAERLQPVTFDRWFNEDEQEIYLVNIRPIPEQETTANQTILENIDYQTYNSNNFFFFEYLFSVGNGSDPIALDRGAGACAGFADRAGCISSDPNFGREIPDSTDETTAIIAAVSVVEAAQQLTVEGDVVTVTVGTATCTTFAGTAGTDVTLTSTSGTSSTVCLPDQYIPSSGTLATIGVTSISGTSGDQQNRCEGTSGDDVIACTTGDDWIEALGGNDAIFADAGDDDVFGGAGDDYIVAGDGNDIVEGGSGYDEIDGGAGDDTINLGADGGVAIGGAGADTFAIDDDHGSSDSSIIGGGTALDASDDGSRDTFDFNGDPNGSIELYTDSADLLDFTDYDSGVTVYPDVVSGSSLSVTVVTGALPSNVSGSAYDDTFNLDGGCVVGTASGCATTPDYNIDGNAGDDVINTSSGNDTIDGGADDDTINSGAGNDTIIMSDSDGTDTIDGGAGTDLIDGSTGSNALIVTLNNATGTIEDTVTGEIDNVSNVENVDTGSGDDQFFISDTDDNVINAGDGDDEATVSGGSGIIFVDRTGDIVDVTDSGGGIGTDEYNFVETINILGSTGNDIILVSDENDNTITGNGGSDIVLTIKNTAVSGTVTITRTGDNVNVSGTGFGTDLYEAISTVYVTGSTEDDTFDLTDENDNTITGNGGTDTVNVYSTANSTEDETITIIRTVSDVTVTSVISGSGGTGIGNDAYNDIDQVNITAGGGDDTFNIFDELDNIFDGGDGIDTVNYSLVSGGLIITIDSSNINTVSGTGIGTDILINIENINGGNGDDTFIIEDEGDNAIDGGGGTDEAFVIMENVYSGVITIIRSPANVVTVSGSGFGTDVYTNIEKVNVTSVGGDDVFRPNDDQDNDFDAAGGTDWIDYSTITGTISVVVDLSTGTATGDGNDTLAGFENISGSIGNDTLTGDSGANIIDGNTGDDTIDGGGGNDTLIGNAGDDIIDGGSGTDTFDESNATTAMDVVLVNGDGSSTSTGQGSDTLTSIENVNTGSGDDTLTIMDSSDNIFNANGGTDEANVSGGSGTITITRSGSDVAVSDDGGGIGTDAYNNVEQVNVSGSASDDTFVVSDANDNEFNGLGGTDSIDYATTSEDIRVEFIDASTAEVSGTSIGTDTLINFEEISTDSGDDLFIFNADVGTVTINSRDGDDVFDFDDASGTLILSDTSGTTFLDFTGYTDGVVIDLGSTSQQTVSLSDSSLLVTLSGTFNNVSGSAFVDNISGTTSVDTIYGGDSADSIWGEGDADFLYGEAGADTIDGGAGADTIDGGADADTLSGGADDDTIDGGAGIDTLNGDAGNDTLNGGADNDIINGGADDDTIDGGDGDDDIDGGTGTDSIDETSNSTGLVVTLSNVAGDGSIVDSAAGETDTVDNVENVDTGSGLDTFFISDSDDNIINAGGDDDVASVYGGSGTITITRSGGDVDVSDTGGGIGTDEYNSVIQVNVSGTSTDDTFIVTDENDNILDGGDGTDTISYETLSTPITVTIVDNQASINATGVGADTLLNFENITTGTGDDYFSISGTVNTGLNSTTGADIFDFNTNVDGSLVLETDDSAYLDFGDFGEGITIDLSSNISQTVATSFIINLSGTFTSISGSAFVDNIDGTAIDDMIYGGDGADTINGNDGADTIFGEAGNDIIDGGAGNDTLSGGAGNDTLDGGADTDTIDESSSTNDLTVTLNNGTGSIVDGLETDSILNVENVSTGSGDDQFFISDSGDNIIDAGGDTNGDEATVSGGTGTITITRSGADVAVSDGSGSGGIGDDQYLNVEQVNISGSATNDTFVVSDSGDNEFDGLGGIDSISYAALSTPITVTIVGNQVTISATGIGADTLYNIENIFTGTGDDYFDINGAVDYGLNSDTGADTFFFKVSVTGDLALETSDSAHLDFSSFISSGITIDLSSAVSQSVTGSLDIKLTGTFTTISGTTLADSISGTTGADTIWADSGDDTIFGDAGADVLDGNAGVDTIDGGAGNDTIDGGTGADDLDGGADDDTITGGTGNDSIDGGAGTDTFDESNSTSNITIVLDSTSGTSSSAVEGNDTLTSIENVTTGSGDDDFTLSDSGVNVISGSTGTDTVTILNAVSITVTRIGADVFVTDNTSGVGNDEYYSIEQVNISGTSGDDSFQMDDELDNIINGQGGTNEVDYSLVTAVINVNVLSSGTTISSTGTGDDTLISIQNITTGDGNDTFVIEENGVNNILDADDGTDTATYTASGTISATRSGSSLMVQVSGSDSDQLDNFENVNFVGGTGDDTFVIQDTNDNTIDGSSEGSNGDTYDTTFTSNDITVTVSSTVTAVGTDIGTDTLIDIENITTGDGDDTFIIDTDSTGTYFFNAGDSTLGNTFEFTGGGTGVIHITISSDSAADDTLDFSQFTGSGIDIDLSDASEQEVATNLFITFNNFMGDVIGTDNDDTIEGNSLDNTIDGGDGNDTIIYSTGDDVIDGGDGTDTVDYTTAPDSITATLTSSTITVAISGTSDTNTITNVEVISGTSNDDTFIISEAVSTTVNAGGGTDVVDYSGLADAINIDLTTGTGNVSGTSSGDDHTLNDVEDVIGSDFDDTIVGNSSDNNLDGGAGDDFIQGNTGDDIIDGGSGTNTVSYQDAGSSVNVDLESGSSSGGDDNDTLTNIDNVSGSAFGDNISGSSGTNVIYGGDGDDTIYGNEGNDELYGEDGADTIYGGSLDAVSGTSDDGSDTIDGGADNDTLYGGNNNTDGGTGNDNSDGGSDIIEGGAGDDTIYGGNNNTNGGSGDDGDDILTDIDPLSTGGLPNDTDTVYGDNNNTNGGTGDAGTDSIDVDDDDNDDKAVGDNQVDSNTNDDPTTGSDQDTIVKDNGDSEDDGDDD